MTFTLTEQEMQQYRHKGKILEAIDKALKDVSKSLLPGSQTHLAVIMLNQVRKELGL